MTPRASQAEILLGDGTSSAEAIERSVELLIQGFGAGEYFNPTDELGERDGAHGVRYKRPAFLILFTPGVGGEAEPRWPVLDKDHQIVESLAGCLNDGVTLFGGSAAAGWPLPAKEPIRKPWLACHSVGGPSIVHCAGIVGMLVETDLAFGCAASHGLQPEYGIAFQATAVRDSGFPETPGPFSVRRSMPPRFHVATLTGRATEDLHLLDNPAARKAKLAPGVLRKGRSGTWRTLVVHEGEDVLANPPYQWPNGRAFIRPLPDGATLYRASGRYSEVLDSARISLEAAIRRGGIRLPEAVLIVDCRGRMQLLGEVDGPRAELDSIRKTIPNNVFGMYGDGETCDSERGTRVHWNWAVAALVLGRDYSQEYAAALRTQLLAQLDQTIAWPAAPEKQCSGASPSSPDRFAALRPVLEELTQSAIRLMQADGCGIRILAADASGLDLCCGSGPLYEVVPQRLSAGPDSPHAWMASSKCLELQKPVFFTKSEYSKSALAYPGWKDGRDGWRPASTGPSIEERLADVEWLVSFPIVEGREFLGTLTVYSRDSQFIARQRDARAVSEARLAQLASKLLTRAAGLIRVCLIRDALVQILSDASSAEGPQDLADVVVRGGARLLGRSVHVLLLRPNDERTRLECLGRTERNDPQRGLTLTLGNASPEEKGISGWVFETGEEFVTDDVSFDADGRNGKPKYREVFPGVEANYVIPLTSPGPGRETLGVLCVEAPGNVLNRSLHLWPIRRIAQVCVPIIKKAKRLERQDRLLRAVLPHHLLEAFKAKDWEWNLESTQPRRQFVSILYVDIRGYTMMSQIVGERRMGRFLGEYYGMIARIVRKTGGTLDKFMGDGAIVLYGSHPPIEHADEACDSIRQGVEAAAEAGLMIAGEFQVLAAGWLNAWRLECPEVKVNHRFEIGASVHTGKPLVGLFHTADGKDGSHITYTAIGRDVNLAARVGNEVDGNSVWVTATSWQFLQSSIKFVTSERKELTALKGVNHEIEIYQVHRKEHGNAGPNR